MDNQEREDPEDTCAEWKRDALVAAGAGGCAAVLVWLGAYSAGAMGQREARSLLEAMMPTTRFLCSAVMAASATILALMLTVLSMTLNAEVNLQKTFYGRIKQIAFHDMLLLIAATCLLVLHCVPVAKTDELPDWWYPSVYYCLLGFSAVLAGAMVTVVCMLYSAITDVIHWLGFEDNP